MMISNPSQKTHIDLEEYDYQKDIENRILMSTFSVFEVEVLEEILLGSLHLSISELAMELDCSSSELQLALNKIVESGLITVSGDEITVDKEMRKYYDTQIEKFDESFRVGMRYFQSLLAKVPIHCLPQWYALPRTTDNIMDGIIDKFLKTPKIYRTYLQESQFEDPIFRGIMDKVFAAEDYKVRSKELREAFDLTREQFELYMLLLEFNFICCLTYIKVGDQWKEVVQPFTQWRDYLQFESKSNPQIVTEDLEPLLGGEFGFADLITMILTGAKEQPLSRDPQEISEKLQEELGDASDEVLHHIGEAVARMDDLELICPESEDLKLLPKSGEWLDFDSEAHAMQLYASPSFSLPPTVPPKLFTDRNIRLIERSLERIMDSGWVEFSDFMRGFTEGLGDSDGVQLKKVGRHWQYAIPTYTPETQMFVKMVIFERLFQSGMTETAVKDGKHYFRLTAHGKLNLSHL